MSGPRRSARERVEAAAGIADLDRLAPRVEGLAADVAESAQLAEHLERRVAELEQLLVPVLRDRVGGDG